MTSINFHELQVVMYYSISKMDKNKPILPQITKLIKVGGSIMLTMINPALGLVFSIFSAMIGKKTNEKAEMVEYILKKVDKMIYRDLSEFAKGLKYEHVSHLLTNMNMAADNGHHGDDWNMIAMDFDVAQMFNASCYNNDGRGSECENYRLKFGAGEALVMEIEYTHLMIQGWLEMLAQKDEMNVTLDECDSRDFYKDPRQRHCDSLDAFVRAIGTMERKIKKAVKLLDGHMNAWAKYRSKDDHFEPGKVERRCAIRNSNCKVAITQGHDNILNKDYYDSDYKCDETTTTKSAKKIDKAFYADRLAACDKAWKESVRAEISELWTWVMAMNAVAEENM